MPVRFPASVERIIYRIKLAAPSMTRKLTSLISFKLGQVKPTPKNVMATILYVGRSCRANVYRIPVNIIWMIITGVLRPVATSIATYVLPSTLARASKAPSVGVAYQVIPAVIPTATTIATYELPSISATASKSFLVNIDYQFKTVTAPTPTEVVSTTTTSTEGRWRR